MIQWAGKTGPATARLVERILSSRAYPEMGYRACLGIMRLGDSKNYGPERLEAAAARALEYNACSFGSVRSILARGLDRRAKPEQEPQPSLPLHENIRGGEYYH